MIVHNDKFMVTVSEKSKVDYDTVQKVFNAADIVAKNYLGLTTEKDKIQLEVLDGFYFMSEYKPFPTKQGVELKPCVTLYSAVSRKANNDITKIARIQSKT